MGVDEQVLVDLQNSWEQKLVESRVFRASDYPITATRDYAGYYMGTAGVRGPPIYSMGGSAASMPMTVAPPVALSIPPNMMAQMYPSNPYYPVRPSAPSNIRSVGQAQPPPRPYPNNNNDNDNDNEGEVGQYDGADDRLDVLLRASEREEEEEKELTESKDQKKVEDTLAASLANKITHESKDSLGITAVDSTDSLKRERPEDELGSDLDDPEDDDFEGDNEDGITDLLLCQYEKINRVRTRWRGVLRAGLANMTGSDYCFSRANMDFDW